MNRQYVMDHNLVDRYLLGQLSDDDSSEFESFYLSCPDTLDELAVTEKIIDSFAASALGARKQKKAANTLESAPKKPQATSARPWQFATLAASLLAAVALLSDRSFSPPSLFESAQTDINIPIISLAATRSGAAPRLIEVPERPVRIAIAMDIGVADTNLYAVEIVDANSQRVWSAQALKPDDYASLTFTLPPGLLTPGGYKFLARAQGSDTVVMSLSVLVKHQEP